VHHLCRPTGIAASRVGLKEAVKEKETKTEREREREMIPRSLVEVEGSRVGLTRG